jgi:hypothetical protein
MSIICCALKDNRMNWQLSSLIRDCSERAFDPRWMNRRRFMKAFLIFLMDQPSAEVRFDAAVFFIW